MGKYVVIAGTDRPDHLMGQTLEANSGQTITSGQERIYGLRKQTIGMPNFSESWGVRLDKDGKIPEKRIDVRDPNYKGQIKPLKWNDPKGYPIPLRYLSSHNTIDKLYQELVLNIAINEDDPSSADAHFLELESGFNEFNEETEPYKCLMLKMHAYNQSSTSKNPSIYNYQFKEFVEEEMVSPEVSLGAKVDAMRMVTQAADDNTQAQLKNLKTAINPLLLEEPKEKDLYNTLLKLADAKPEAFLEQIANYKRDLANIFEKAKSYKLLDLTKDGTIVAGKEKKQVIGEGIPAKGEDMMAWLLTNFTDDKAQETIFKLKQITDQIK